MKDNTQCTGTKREKRKRRRIKHNSHDTNREKRKRRRIKHNTHIPIERREKEGGENTIHTYKKRRE